jgi:hypothetical protein
VTPPEARSPKEKKRKQRERRVSFLLSPFSFSPFWIIVASSTTFAFAHQKNANSREKKSSSYHPPEFNGQ